MVLKACAGSIEDRYKTAAELHDDLEAVSAGKRPAHADPELIERMRDWRAGDEEASDKAAGHMARKKSRRPAKIAAVAAGLFLAVAGATWYSIPKEITDITGLEPDTEIYIGESVTPEYVIEPDWFRDSPVTFSSSNEKIFTVSETGAISAVSVGEAELHIYSEDYSETDRITVIPKVTTIGGIKSSVSLTEGETLKLNPKLKPKKFKDEPITYDSSDPAVAAVTQEGIIAAVAPGKTSITLTSGGCEKKIKVTVEEEPVVYYSDPGSGYSGSTSSGTSKASGGKKKSGSKSGKSGGGGSEGYIDSIDDEYFD